MPIYEHKCQDCGHRFEVIVSISDSNKPQPCPSCNVSDTVRLISRSTFKLKGLGWAKDGYSK